MEGFFDDDVNPVIKDRANLDRIRSLADPELQKYIDHPPGVGKSVMYVAVNIKNGKAYVGKHGHCTLGQSFSASRKKDHENPKDDRHTYFAYAMRKYGPESFEWYILWHGDASDEDDMEVFLISPAGVHTRKEDNGWGYNLRVGGEGGQHSEETIQKMKAQAKAQKKREEAADPGVHSRRAKAQMEREATAGMKSLTDRGREYLANETEEQKTERVRKITETTNTAEYVAAASARHKAQIEHQIAAGAPTCTDRILEYSANETEEQKAKRIQRMTETRNTVEYVAAASARGKAQAQREEEANPGERSRRSKERMAREAAAGMKTLSERASDVAQVKRAEKLAKMTPVEQERQKRKYEREDRATAKQKADLEQLRKIPGHENDKQRDLPAARKAGLILPKPAVVLTPAQEERHAHLQKILGYKLPKEQFANWVPPEERAKESDAPSSPTPIASSSIASSSTDPIASSTTAQKRKAQWLEASDDED